MSGKDEKPLAQDEEDLNATLTDPPPVKPAVTRGQETIKPVVMKAQTELNDLIAKRYTLMTKAKRLAKTVRDSMKEEKTEESVGFCRQEAVALEECLTSVTTLSEKCVRLVELIPGCGVLVHSADHTTSFNDLYEVLQTAKAETEIWLKQRQRRQLQENADLVAKTEALANTQNAEPDAEVNLQDQLASLRRELNTLRLKNSMASPDDSGWRTIASTPKIKCPDFNGDLMKQDVNEFISCFKSCYMMSYSSRAARFSTLRQHVKGEAAKIISNLTDSETIMDDAFELLRKRYGDPKKRVWALENQFKNEKRVLDNKEFVKIRALLDKMAPLVRAVKSDGEKPGTNFIMTLANKLPVDYPKFWMEKVRDKKLVDNDVDGFLDACNEKFDADIFIYRNFKYEKPKYENPQKSKPAANGSTNVELSMAANVSSASGGKNSGKGNQSTSKSKCVKCLKQHDLQNCPSFKELKGNQRFVFVRNNGVCYACLKTGHSVEKCPNAKTCKIDGCSRKHHHMLHT